MKHKNLSGDNLHIGRANSGASSPVGVVTPSIIGEFYWSTAASTLYVSTGLANTNWVVGSGGGITPQGDWNADTNTPDISTATVSGYFWIVSVAGTTNLDGITDWEINDWAVKTATGWTKVDNTDKVMSVNTQTGVVVLDADDIDDTSTTNKFVIANDITNLGNLSGSNTGDQSSTDFTHNSLTGLNDGTDYEHITETQETNFETAYTHSNLVVGNPHVVTKTEIGLSAVPNTDCTNASNISSGTISSSILPPVALTTVQVAVSQVAMLALTTEEGDVVVRSDENKSYMRNAGVVGDMTDFTELQTPTDSVLSVNGETGTVVLTTGDISESVDDRFVTDAQLVVIGNTSNTNTGDQTDIADFTGTKAEFDTACTDDNFAYLNQANAFTNVGDNTFVGKVGIGTTTPGHKLTVKGDGVGTMVAFSVEDSNDGEVFGVRDDGIIVSLPTYAATTAASANMYISIAGQMVRATSSRKIKTDIKSNVNPSDALKLNPVTFKEKATGLEYTGFIAEEVRDINPHFANDDKDLPALEMNAIVSALTATVQTQEARITELENDYQQIVQILQNKILEEKK